MPNCEAIDTLVTPYIDDQLADADRQVVDAHLRACPPCHSRVAAERAVRELLQTRKSALAASCCPSPALRARCADAAHANPHQSSEILGHEAPGQGFSPAASRNVGQGFSPAASRSVGHGFSPAAWRQRFAPLAAAASLVLIVGIAFLYQLTASSNRVLAAELAADHVKCFALNGVLHTHDDAAAVESSMWSRFGWRMRLPDEASKAGLELVGARPCLYGEGKIAHIMYRHNGEPVSLFMLPRTERAQEFVQVLGHQAAIWCAGNRTFVLMAKEPKEEVERIATAVRASLR